MNAKNWEQSSCPSEDEWRNTFCSNGMLSIKIKQTTDVQERGLRSQTCGW